MARLWSNMTIESVLAAALLSLAAPAFAASPPTWIVDKGASRLTFSSTFSGEDFVGTFRRWDAQIQFDPADLADSKAAVSIDMGSASTGEESRDDALPTADWFSVDLFPKASFVTRQIKFLGGDKYEADGDLTIRDTTKPVVLPFTLTITGDQAKMAGHLTIDRTTFGVGQGQFGSGDSVPLEVGIDVSIQARRAP